MNDELRKAINIILNKIDNERALKTIYHFAEKILLGKIDAHGRYKADG